MRDYNSTKYKPSHFWLTFSRDLFSKTNCQEIWNSICKDKIKVTLNLYYIPFINYILEEFSCGWGEAGNESLDFESAHGGVALKVYMRQNNPPPECVAVRSRSCTRPWLFTVKLILLVCKLGALGGHIRFYISKFQHGSNVPHTSICGKIFQRFFLKIYFKSVGGAKRCCL